MRVGVEEGLVQHQLSDTTKSIGLCEDTGMSCNARLLINVA